MFKLTAAVMLLSSRAISVSSIMMKLKLRVICHRELLDKYINVLNAVMVLQVALELQIVINVNSLIIG